MRYVFIAASLALALPLGACADLPQQAGQVSTVSGQVRISANKIYTSASKLGEAMVQNGLLDRAEFKRRDAQAYTVLLKVRLGQATVQDLTAAAAAITK